MAESETTHQVANAQEAILAVMQEVEYVQKERAQGGGVSYSIKTEEGVLQALRPAMLKYGLIMLPVGVNEIYHDSYDTKNSTWNRFVATFTYRFQHVPSNTFVEVQVIGDGADPGDKAANKAMTGSKKYALLEAFLLITGDDPDNTASPERAKAPKEARPFSPMTLIRELNRSAKWHENNGTALPSREQQDLTYAALADLLPDGQADTFIERVFSKGREALVPTEWVAVSGWMNDADLALTEADMLLGEDDGDYA